MDKKLIRFIPCNDLKRVFKYDPTFLFNSTFIMRSLDYYRSCEDKARHDPHDGSIKTKALDYKSLNRWLVSCWSILDEINQENLFKKFCPDGGIAVISSVSKVDEVIQRSFKRLCKANEFDENHYKSRKVEYYSEQCNYSAEQCNNDQAPFYKKDSFKDEYEYRFAIVMDLKIESIIFEVKVDYIEKIITYNKNFRGLTDFCDNNKIELVTNYS